MRYNYQNILRLLALVICQVLFITSYAQQKQKGFYKDLFMDSGMMLTSRVDLAASRLADFTMESFISTPHSYTEKFSFTDADTIMQNQLICGSAIDENGILLYPDGAPRFRVVYMNGGRAKAHGGKTTACLLPMAVVMSVHVLEHS